VLNFHPDPVVWMREKKIPGSFIILAITPLGLIKALRHWGLDLIVQFNLCLKGWQGSLGLQACRGLPELQKQGPIEL